MGSVISVISKDHDCLSSAGFGSTYHIINIVPQRSIQMRVGNFFCRKLMQQLQIVSAFFSFKLIDCYLTVIYS